MMNLREKYGQWGVILGATEGVGKAFAEYIAQGGMNVVLVGRREEALNKLGEEISKKFKVKHLVVAADFAKEDSVTKVTEATKDLDMGFMAYVACFHTFGKMQDTPWSSHEQMLNVNILTFLKFFYHYMNIFAKQDRGAIINVSSLTAITSSPYNAQYGAGKAFILKMTEAVAYESEKTNVDVLVVTAGSTRTPSFLRNLPGGPDGHIALENAMEPSDVVKEAFDNLGKNRSIVAGERNRKNVHHWQCDMTSDEASAYMGSFYEK